MVREGEDVKEGCCSMILKWMENMFYVGTKRLTENKGAWRANAEHGPAE